MKDINKKILHLQKLIQIGNSDAVVEMYNVLINENVNILKNLMYKYDIHLDYLSTQTVIHKLATDIILRLLHNHNKDYKIDYYKAYAYRALKIEMFKEKIKQKGVNNNLEENIEYELDINSIVIVEDIVNIIETKLNENIYLTNNEKALIIENIIYNIGKRKSYKKTIYRLKSKKQKEEYIHIMETIKLYLDRIIANG